MAFGGLGGGSVMGNGLIRIGAVTNGLRGQVKGAVNDMKRELDAGANSIKAKSSAWSSAFGLIGAAAKIGFAGVVGALGAGIAASISFEKAWAGVRKTVDATPARLERLRGEFRQLAKEIPISVNELAKVGETAGALGVATESILTFTKVTAELGSTTNVSSDQAATALGQLSNVLKLTEKDYERFGSTLVDLGNKGASTESQILDIASRAGAAGKLIGLSTPDILAWGSAVASLGIETEAGGSALQFFFLQASKVINEVSKTGPPSARAMAEAQMKVTLAYENQTRAIKKHGKASHEAQQASLSLMKAQDGLEKLVHGTGAALETMAKTAGVTVAEFKRLYAEDATKALSLFLTGLGKLPAGAQQGVLAIEKLNNIRVIRAILGLANNAGELNRQLTVGETAWQENVALANAAGKRYETTAAQLSILKNIFFDMLIEIGDSLNPAVKVLVHALQVDLPKAGAFIGSLWNGILRPAFEKLGEAFGHLLDAVNGIFGADSKSAAGSWGGTVSGVATGLTSVLAQLVKVLAVIIDGFAWLLNNPIGQWASRAVLAFVAFRVAVSGGAAAVAALQAKSKGLLRFLSFGKLGGGGGGIGAAAAAPEAAAASEMSLAAKEHMGAAAALKGAALALSESDLRMAGLMPSRNLGGPIRYTGTPGLATSLSGNLARQQRAAAAAEGAALAANTSRGLVAGLKGSVRGGFSQAGSILKSGLGLVSKAFWPLMIADIGIEFVKAPLGDFIAGNTQFKRAGARIRDDFFGGLISLVQSWAVGSDAWVGRAETVQIGNSTFKTITLAKLGITNATFDKLEAPVGTITHAEGQLEVSQKLSTGLGQQAGESIGAWWKRIQDQLPDAVKAGAAKYFKTGVRGAYLADDQGLAAYLANATVNQIGDLNVAVRDDYVSALTTLLADRGYTTGQIAGLSTDQLANIGNMAATDTSGKFTFVEDFLLDTYMGKLGKQREVAGKDKSNARRRTKGNIVGALSDVVSDLGPVEKRTEAAITAFYRSIPQNVQDGLNAFITQTKNVDPGILAKLRKKFGDDWLTAFKDGTTAITDKPVDKAVVTEMVRVFGPKWRERLKGFGSLLFEREGGKDAETLRASLAAAIAGQIAKLTPAELSGGKKPLTTKAAATDRANIQKYISSAIGQAALANASSPDVTTAKKGMADLGTGLKKAIPDQSTRDRLIAAMVAIQRAGSVPNLDELTKMVANVPAADRGLGLVANALDYLAERAYAFINRVSGGTTASTGRAGSGAKKAASGLAGTTMTGTHIFAGEAGHEAVAIIRNFKRLALPDVAAALSAGGGRSGVTVNADKLQLFSDGSKRSLDTQLGFLAAGGR